ncbi:hypothetical protein [Edaphobacter sp. HDX4]|uniref:hypothetical protein n=1 Tax=Edaphobacter sp. HDX4 TaxID=2794064 RepID=UPI002FE6A6BF
MTCCYGRGLKGHMESLDILGFSYDERADVLPGLLVALADCGGWVLDRRALTTNLIELRVEVQLRSILELYSSIVAAGLELTRSSHLALTDLCTCRRNVADATDLGHVLTVKMKINFLEEVSLHSLLESGRISA